MMRGLSGGRRLEKVEKLKAEERMKSTLKQNKNDTATENFPERSKGETRDQVAKQAGFGSGKNYEKAKFIAENADEETIKKLNDERREKHDINL